MAKTRRPAELRRSWVFLPGSERDVLYSAASSGADVLIQELEDFTPPHRRPEARALSPALLAYWHTTPVTVAVRINPLETGGLDDLAAVMPGRPDVVMMAMVARADQIVRLDAEITGWEAKLGLVPGSTEIVPNIETAAGLVATGAICAASPRVTAALVAAEDMASDLGAERTPDCRELSYARQRFLMECVAAGVVAIDCPYTFRDLQAAEQDLKFARGLGYKAKSIANIDQIPLVNRLLTPSADELSRARAMVDAFDAARARGEDRAFADGLMVEVPTYRAARRLIARAEALSLII